jgi:centromeric protein E
MISFSLLTFSKVLTQLMEDRSGHISYRDSKLTNILKPSLSGNARMVAICCVNAANDCINETRNTLDFAKRAMRVTTHAQQNKTIGNSKQLKKAGAIWNALELKTREKFSELESTIQLLREQKSVEEKRANESQSQNKLLKDKLADSVLKENELMEHMCMAEKWVGQFQSQIKLLKDKLADSESKESELMKQTFIAEKRADDL